MRKTENDDVEEMGDNIYHHWYVDTAEKKARYCLEFLESEILNCRSKQFTALFLHNSTALQYQHWY